MLNERIKAKAAKGFLSAVFPSFAIAAAIGMGAFACTKSPSESPAARAPAASGCPACDELGQLRKSLLEKPSPETAKLGSPKRAKLEIADLAILKSGGQKIAALFKEGANSAEVRAAALFLGLTAERDPGGIALDWMITLLGERADASLIEIEKEVRDLRKEKALTPIQAEAFATTLAVIREESSRGQN
jgi:hypothetical protein